MTQLNSKPLIRETGLYIRARGKLRPLVLEAHAGYCLIRPKGLQHGYAVDWLAVYHLGGRQAAMAARQEKKARRIGRAKKARRKTKP